MLRVTSSGVNEGIRVGGHLILSCIKTVSFADDQATLAGSFKGLDLQLMMDKMQETAGEYGMKINAKKTKEMKISKRPGEELTIYLEGKLMKSRIAL